jgi:hypothetical protein
VRLGCGGGKGYHDGGVSISMFLVLTGVYIVIFGGISGAFAAWITHAGSSPLRHLASAYRTRAGSPR